MDVNSTKCNTTLKRLPFDATKIVDGTEYLTFVTFEPDNLFVTGVDFTIQSRAKCNHNLQEKINNIIGVGGGVTSVSGASTPTASVNGGVPVKVKLNDSNIDSYQNIKAFIFNHGTKTDIKNMETMLTDGRISSVNVRFIYNENSTLEKYNNCTALMYQSNIGTIEAMEFLLKKGANINLQNKYGYTALHSSLQKNEDNVEKVNLLLKNGADVDIKTIGIDIHTKTALQLASELGLSESKKAIEDFIKTQTTTTTKK